MSSFALWQPDLICGFADIARHAVAARVQVEHRDGLPEAAPCRFQRAGRDHDPQLGSPVRHLGLLAEGLARSWIEQAARAGLAFERLEVIVTATAGPDRSLGVEAYPRDIDFEVVIATSAGRERIAALQAAAERGCAILNMLRGPQPIAGAFTLVRPHRATLFDAPAASRYEAVRFAE